VCEAPHTDRRNRRKIGAAGPPGGVESLGDLRDSAIPQIHNPHGDHSWWRWPFVKVCGLDQVERDLRAVGRPRRTVAVHVQDAGRCRHRHP
jgi:hypothetical protein